MAKTRRELIKDDLMTSLAAIQVASGYRNTVVTVEDTLRTWDEVGSEEVPYIGVAADSRNTEEWECGATNQIEIKGNYCIVAHIAVANRTERYTKLSDLIDDIKFALMSKTKKTRGLGNAKDTQIKRIDTDESDYELDPNRPYGTMRIDFWVKYAISTEKTP